MDAAELIASKMTVRIPEAMHVEIRVAAARGRKTLEEWVREAVNEKLKREARKSRP